MGEWVLHTFESSESRRSGINETPVLLAVFWASDWDALRGIVYARYIIQRVPLDSFAY